MILKSHIPIHCSLMLLACSILSPYIFYIPRYKWIASDPQLNIDLVEINKVGDSIALSHLRYDEAAKMLGV